MFVIARNMSLDARGLAMKVEIRAPVQSIRQTDLPGKDQRADPVAFVARSAVAQPARVKCDDVQTMIFTGEILVAS